MSINAPSLQTPIDVEDISTGTYSAVYNVQNVDRMSIQANAVDSTPADPTPFVAADVTPSVKASGTMTIVQWDHASMAGATVTVAGHALVEGVDWTAETSNNVTADNLAAAIDALTEVVAPNPAAAVITITAATAGTAGNDIDTTTTAAAGGMTVSGATLTGGEDHSTITVAAHGLVTGLEMALTGTNLPSGLSATDYWIIVVDEDTIQLASSKNNALAGTYVVIATAGTTADAELTAPALDSTTVEVKCSLDGISYFSYASPKTITITGTGNQFLDIGQLTVPWVKVTWTAPVEGLLSLEVLAWFQNTQVGQNS